MPPPARRYDGHRARPRSRAGDRACVPRRALPRRAPGLRVARDGEHDADREQGGEQRGAARGDEWQRHTEDGEDTEHDTDIDNAWPMIHTSTAAVAACDEGRAGRAEHAGERDREQRRRAPMHHDRADEAELLADDREDEVVVGGGQPRPLRRRVAEADAEHAAVRERERAVLGLPAVVDASSSRVQSVEERHDAAHAGSRSTTATMANSATAAEDTGRSSSRSRTPMRKSAPSSMPRHDHHGAEVAAERARARSRRPPTMRIGHDAVREVAELRLLLRDDEARARARARP